MPTPGIEAKLLELGLALPPLTDPIASYVPFVITSNLLFIAGQGPRAADGPWLTGKVGAEISTEAAYEHARLTGLRMLAVAKSALGSLDRIHRVVKLLGFVNATPTFTDHPKVINGCSDLFITIFGDAGRHARSAVGVASLPLNITVEIEGIFEIRH